MKLFLSIAMLLTAVQASAYRESDNYVIFEEGDNEIFNSYKNFLKRQGIYLQELIRDDVSKEKYALLDKAKEQLHKTYLKYFKVSEQNYPMPYVIFEMGQYSANFSAPTQSGYKPSNFISLSLNHISNEGGLWSILAHEMAHYYHKHAAKKSQFIKASYTEHEHRELSQENGYGMDIDNSPELAAKLDQILLAARAYEGGRGNVANLSKVRIGPNDPMIKAIAREYQGLVGSVEMACSAIVGRLNEIISKGDLTTSDLNSLNPLAKSCTRSKDGEVSGILKYMYKPQIVSFLTQKPDLLLNAPGLAIREIAKSILENDHAIVTGLKAIMAYRTELKQLVESIDWDNLQFYTHENEADITAFKILNELGIAHYQLNMLEFVFNKNKCVDSITDAEIEVEYFGVTELDTHHSSCWRVYRTMQMLKGISNLDVNIKIK
jgi:hypothetical protein